MSENSFGAKGPLQVGGREFEIFRLHTLAIASTSRACRTRCRVLLENLLRHEGSGTVERLGRRGARRLGSPRRSRAARSPSRPRACCMQDFTGVPAIVDLAAMRDAIAEIGGDPAGIDPLVPVELVIDHSVQVDAFGSADAFRVERRARVRAQPRALRLPALGAGRLRQPRGRAARARASATR